MTTFAGWSITKGAPFGDLSSVTFTASAGAGVANSVAVVVDVTNVGTATGIMVKDIITSLRALEAYLLARGPNLVPAQTVDPAFPGQY